VPANRCNRHRRNGEIASRLSSRAKSRRSDSNPSRCIGFEIDEAVDARRLSRIRGSNLLLSSSELSFDPIVLPWRSPWSPLRPGDITGYGTLIYNVDRGGSVQMHPLFVGSVYACRWPPLEPLEQFALAIPTTRAKELSFRLGKRHPCPTSGAYDG